MRDTYNPSLFQISKGRLLTVNVGGHLPHLFLKVVDTQTVIAVRGKRHGDGGVTMSMGSLREIVGDHRLVVNGRVDKTRLTLFAEMVVEVLQR